MKKDKRSLSLLQSLLSLLLFLILSGAEAPRLEKPKQKKNRDGVDGHSPTSLPGTLSITLPATHCSIFKSHSHIFSSPPPFSCFRPSPPSLPPLSLLLSVGVLSVTAGLRLGHRVPVNVDRSSTCGAAALPMFADLFRMRSDTTRAHTTDISARRCFYFVVKCLFSSDQRKRSELISTNSTFEAKKDQHLEFSVSLFTVLWLRHYPS